MVSFMYIFIYTSPKRQKTENIINIIPPKPSNKTGVIKPIMNAQNQLENTLIAIPYSGKISALYVQTIGPNDKEKNIS